MTGESGRVYEFIATTTNVSVAQVYHPRSFTGFRFFCRASLSHSVLNLQRSINGVDLGGGVLTPPKKNM